MNTVFSLENIQFKDILSVNSLDFPMNAVTCILGKSGSGKTTLLRMLNRTVIPDSGSIFFKGEDAALLNPVSLRRSVSLLGQTPVIFSGNVKENLQIGLRFAGKEEMPDSALEAALEKVHLDKPLDASPSAFSGGEKQRLALARTLLINPEVLLLDEPTAALDEHTERSVFEHIIATATEKRSATIMVTHSRWVADAFADYLVQIDRGRITETGYLAEKNS